MKKPTKFAPAPLPPAPDPLDVNQRVYRQLAYLLDQLEKKDEDDHVTIKERIAALACIARVQYIFLTLRIKEPRDEQSGTTVRKYADAFKNEAGGGKTRGRPKSKPESEPEPDDWFEHSDIADGGDRDEFDA